MSQILEILIINITFEGVLMLTLGFFVIYVSLRHQNRGLHITVTFVAQMQFRPDISTAVPNSRKCKVSKSQEFHNNYEFISLKR